MKSKPKVVNTSYNAHFKLYHYECFRMLKCRFNNILLYNNSQKEPRRSKQSMKLMLVVGALPQIIKSAPIIHEVQKHREIELQLVHTGQHYDFEMSKIFFHEMTLPDPIVNLGIGSGSHAWQTGNMMIKLERTIIEHKPDIVTVPGDTNSTLAGALTAVKL